MTTYDEAKTAYESKQRELEEAKKLLDAAAKQRKKETILEILALMAEFEVSIDDLQKHAVKKKPTQTRKERLDKGKKLPPKYRDPETGKTWSGRGVAPDWVKAAGENGKLNTLEITQQQLI